MGLLKYVALVKFVVEELIPILRPKPKNKRINIFFVQDHWRTASMSLVGQTGSAFFTLGDDGKKVATPLSEAISAQGGAARFQMLSEVLKTLAFKDMKKVITDIITTEVGGPDIYSPGNKSPVVRKPTLGGGYSFDTLAITAFDDKVADAKSKRRVTALISAFNTLGKIEGALFDEFTTKYDQLWEEYGQDLTSYNPAVLRNELITHLSPWLQKQLKKNASWMGMITILLKDYNNFIPARLKAIFSAGPDLSSPGAMMKLGKRKHKHSSKGGKKRKY